MRPPRPRPEEEEPDAEAALAPAEMNRRQALELLGAGAALGVAGCLREPGEDIRPYAQVPPELHPGTPTYYATSLVEDGFATGVIVETHEGRPTKLDGHPRHPASLGGSTAAQQAALFGLYDPHRARLPGERGVPTAWSRALAALAAPPPGPLWLVLPPQSSPTVAALLARVAERHPGTQVVTVGGVRDGVYRGAALAYGAPLEVQLELRRADRLVAFDADPLAQGPMSPRLARDFAARRRPARPDDDPGRVWLAEPMPTPTGTIADHRLALPAGDVLALVVSLAAALGRRGVALPWRLPERILAAAATRVDGAPGRRAWVDALAQDLAGTRGASALVVGARQPPACHALVHALNAALGNLGRAVTLTAPALLDPLGGRRLADLAQASAAGAAGAVVILDVNPVYQAPPALGLAAALARVPLTAHLSRYVDETARACRWVLPATHDLEAWGDARAADGTLSFAQPLVRPLVPARSVAELLAALAGDVQPDGRALLHAQHAGRDLDALLGEGFDGASAFAPAAATLGDGAAVVAALDEAFAAAAPASPAALELALAPSPTIGDGRLADHAWLEELPHPITKQTWGNAALLSPATAAHLRVQDGQLVRLRAGARSVLAPVLAVAGHADGSVTLELGHGRDAPDEVFAHGVGASGFALLGDDERARILPGLVVDPTDGHAPLARTQGSFGDDGRGLAPHADLATWRRDPRLGRRHEPLPTMLPERHAPPSTSATTPTLQWAMTIDTTICTGCSACVIACQAENNIPSVGAAEVRRGREMHWLRIDSYWYDEPGAAVPTVVHQPMLCQHCEHAPCEYVCPVFATEHSPDGLNEMVYNRCVGTRFCSNNCPYKVRRFNWRGYTRGQGTLALQRNPDVTVRQRGVMEKCTYCVQRIRSAEIRARVEQRAIAPGEVVTACQAACPTGAIAFGALEHEDGEMARRRAESRRYAVLEELGTRPRTLYLAKIANPHPELAPAAPGAKP